MARDPRYDLLFEPARISSVTARNASMRCRAPPLVMVGARFANDALYAEFGARSAELEPAGIRSVTRIGDALAPGAIVHAVYSGHRYARELDAGSEGCLFRRDQPLPRSA